MKILFIDFDTNGHHGIYLKTLLELASDDSVLILPHTVEGFSEQQYCIESFGRNMSLRQYRKVLYEIESITNTENPDVIHILSGDFLYRFFGLGLDILTGCVLVTFHHMIFNPIRNFSYRCIFKKINRGIVHTDFIYKQIEESGIKNVSKIEYPCFEKVLNVNLRRLRKTYGIPDGKKVLLSFGGTRYDKGLDILLNALKGIGMPFHLMIAGVEEDFSKEFIDEHIKGYKENVTYQLSYIEEEKMEEMFAICDIVVLPYRRKFAGASGPLTTGVANGKMIVASDHNSIGNIVTENHLGRTFKVEDVDDLRRVIKQALIDDFIYDENALNYKIEISKESFLQQYDKLYKAIIK